MLRVVVFASGRGSNARTIFALSQKHPDKISVVALITNRPTAGVLVHANSYGIPSFVVPINRSIPKEQRRSRHEEDIEAVLAQFTFDYICLAGYMRIFTPDFIARHQHPLWPVSNIINIHPSLLPSFPGMHGYEDAFQYGVKYSGVTLHFVDAGVDTGAIIHQEIVPRKSEDSLAQFQERGLQQEHHAYQVVLLALADKRYHVCPAPFSIFLKV